MRENRTPGSVRGRPGQPGVLPRYGPLYAWDSLGLAGTSIDVRYSVGRGEGTLTVGGRSGSANFDFLLDSTIEIDFDSELVQVPEGTKPVPTGTIGRKTKIIIALVTHEVTTEAGDAGFTSHWISANSIEWEEPESVMELHNITKLSDTETSAMADCYWKKCVNFEINGETRLRVSLDTDVEWEFEIPGVVEFSIGGARGRTTSEKLRGSRSVRACARSEQREGPYTFMRLER